MDNNVLDWAIEVNQTKAQQVNSEIQVNELLNGSKAYMERLRTQQRLYAIQLQALQEYRERRKERMMD